MLAVEKWAEGRPPLIALFAPQVATFAREIPEILRHQKKNRLLSHTFPIPHLPSWQAMYRSRSTYLLPFLQMALEESPYAHNLLTFSAVMQDLSRNPEQLSNLDITPELLAEGQGFLRELHTQSFQDIQDGLADTPLPPETRNLVQNYMDRHDTEIAFLFLVAFPCWMLLKECPSRLYRKARLGDTNAIENLLRLDPFMLHDPAIGREIQKIRIYGKRKVYEDLLNAPLKPIKDKLTKHTIKDQAAGLISFWAESIKQPLTSIEVRDLLDAVAQDVDKKDIDTSLPESKEAYLKVIQRNRPAWKLLHATRHKKLK